MKKCDIIIICIVIAISTICWIIYKAAFSGKQAVAEIYYKSALVETIDLSAGIERTFSIPQNDKVIFHVYKDGSICFEESDCPDKVCIRAGKLDTVGEFAACLPNSIVLKIAAKNHQGSDDFDIIVG